MRTFEWAIEDILDAYPSLCLEEHAAMAVAIMTPAAKPCEFLVEIEGVEIPDMNGGDRFVLSVTWGIETAARAARIERTKQRTPIVEGAAVALAMLLLSHLIRDSDLTVTKRQDRADFVLTKVHRAIEISGTENASELTRRQRLKRRQVLENAFGLDGYVMICCFDSDKRVIRWTHQPQKG